MEVCIWVVVVAVIVIAVISLVRKSADKAKEQDNDQGDTDSPTGRVG